MKKIFFLTAILILSFTAKAQEVTKQKEAGINFQNLSNFGLSFKTGSEQALWRMNASLNGHGRTPNTFIDNLERKESSFGYGISLGREMRKPITENFEWRYGIDLFTGFYQTRTIEEQGATKVLQKQWIKIMDLIL